MAKQHLGNFFQFSFKDISWLSNFFTKDENIDFLALICLIFIFRRSLKIPRWGKKQLDETIEKFLRFEEKSNLNVCLVNATTHVIFVEDSEHQRRELCRVSVGKELCVNFHKSLLRQQSVRTILQKSFVPLPDLLFWNWKRESIHQKNCPLLWPRG